MDQNRLERQVEQPPPLPLEPRTLEVLPAGAGTRESAITQAMSRYRSTSCRSNVSTQRVCKQPVALDPVTDLLLAATSFLPFSYQWIAWQLYTQQWIQSSC